jgi:hypothetical protein
MLRALADCVDARLVLVVQGVQALTAAAAAHLPASAVFEAHRNEYYPNVQPFQHNFGWPAVKQCNPAGNCNFGTALLAVLGTEDWGRTALRLRNLQLLHFLPNFELYHAALGDMDRDAARTDFREGIFHDLARTGSYLTKLTCAISATVLQCPVVLYNPGFTTHRNRQYECGYMPPLFVHDPDIKKFLHRKKHDVVDVHKTGRVGGACHGTACTPISEADARPQPTASQLAAPGTCTTPQGTDRHLTVVTYNPMGGSTTDLDIHTSYTYSMWQRCSSRTCWSSQSSKSAPGNSGGTFTAGCWAGNTS